MVVQPHQIASHQISDSAIRYHQVQDKDDNENGNVIRIASFAPTPPTPSSPSASVNSGKGSPACPPRRTKTKRSLIRKGFKCLKSAYNRAVADHWTYELLAVFVCVSTLTAIIVILYAFQNKPSPYVMKGVSLNAAISILATLSRAATVLVAAAVIAQQKWLRFETKDRSLIDVITYDDATRGPLGSLYLLITLRFEFITAFAALVAVLASGFEPFVQQSVKYPNREYPVSNSTAPLIPAVQDLQDGNFNTNSNLSIAFAAVITQALYADSVEVYQPSCSPNVCRWPLYKSVAFCSSCEDAMKDVNISAVDDTILQTHNEKDYLNSLQITNLDFGYNAGSFMTILRNTTYNVGLGQGYTAAFTLYTNYTFALMGTYTSNLSYPSEIVWDLSEPPAYTTYYWYKGPLNGIDSPLQSFGHVVLDLTPDGKRLVAKSATRCVISLCAQQYNGTHGNGSLSTQITDMNWGYTLPTYGFDAFTWRTNLTGTNFTSDLSPTYLEAPFKQLTGSVLNSSQSFDYTRDSKLQLNPNADSIQFMSNITKACTNIAQGLTNYIQQYGDSVVPGKGYNIMPVVEVHWAWLAYPISLVVIAVACLIVTIWQSHNRNLPNWKSSPFPLFFNYHDPISTAPNSESRSHETEAETLVPQQADAEIACPLRATKTSAHEKLADSTTIRLRRVANSWLLERQPDTPKRSSVISRVRKRVSRDSAKSAISSCLSWMLQYVQTRFRRSTSPR